MNIVESTGVLASVVFRGKSVVELSGFKEDVLAVEVSSWYTSVDGLLALVVMLSYPDTVVEPNLSGVVCKSVKYCLEVTDVLRVVSESSTIDVNVLISAPVDPFSVELMVFSKDSVSSLVVKELLSVVSPNDEKGPSVVDSTVASNVVYSVVPLLC